MVKSVSPADAVAEAIAGIQRDLAARLAEHGESAEYYLDRICSDIP